MYYLRWNLPKSGDRYGVLRVEDNQFTWTTHKKKATKFSLGVAKVFLGLLDNNDIEITKD